MYPIIIDNFFEDPDSIRNYALNLEYRSPNRNNHEYWLGYRSFAHCRELEEYIFLKIKSYNQNINKLLYFFHFTLTETKKTSPWDFEDYKIHTDMFRFAGVIYLYPQPPKNTGLCFYNENKIFMHSVENIYNRFIFYPGNFFHAPDNFFGDSKENGRLTLSIFCN